MAFLGLPFKNAGNAIKKYLKRMVDEFIKVKAVWNFVETLPLFG